MRLVNLCRPFDVVLRAALGLLQEQLLGAEVGGGEGPTALRYQLVHQRCDHGRVAETQGPHERLMQRLLTTQIAVLLRPGYQLSVLRGGRNGVFLRLAPERFQVCGVPGSGLRGGHSYQQSSERVSHGPSL